MTVNYPKNRYEITMPTDIFNEIVQEPDESENFNQINTATGGELPYADQFGSDASLPNADERIFRSTKIQSS